jgi:F0F1-type ATP synthase membrane subunit b/b'
MMVLVIFLTNLPTRKIKEMKKMKKTRNNYIKEKYTKINSSRKVFAPSKKTPH